LAIAHLNLKEAIYGVDFHMI